MGGEGERREEEINISIYEKGLAEGTVLKESKEFEIPNRLFRTSRSWARTKPKQRTAKQRKTFMFSF